LIGETPEPWKDWQGPIGSQLGKGPLKAACLKMGVTTFQATYQCRELSEKLEETLRLAMGVCYLRCHTILETKGT